MIEKAIENKVKKTLRLARKYRVSQEYIESLISLKLYNKSQKKPNHKFSIIRDLLSSYFGFEYSSDICGDGNAEYSVVAVTPFEHIVQENRKYNCCGINMCTVAERKKIEKTLMKYENSVSDYRKPVALGERARKKPKTPNFLKDIEDGVLVCSNSKDLTFSVRFLKPQDSIETEERLLRNYCGEHTCPMRNGFGENRKVHYIDGTDFIKTAGRIIEERDVSGGRIFSDVEGIVKELLEKFPLQKLEVSPEIV